MANRTMQQKKLKLKREKRAWAKSYSQSGYKVPNRGVLNEYKERALGLGVNEFEVDELVRTHYNREPIYGFTPGQKEVSDLLTEMKKRVPEMMFFVIIDNAIHRYVCNHNSVRNCYSISHTDKRLKIMKTSIEYGSKDLAISLLHQGRLRWATKIPVDSPAAG